MNDNMTERSGAVTPEKDKSRNAHNSAPSPENNAPPDFEPLLDLKPEHAMRPIPHRLALAALQLFNDTVALGAVLLILFALLKLMEALQ